MRITLSRFVLFLCLACILASSRIYAQPATEQGMFALSLKEKIRLVKEYQIPDTLIRPFFNYFDPIYKATDFAFFKLQRSGVVNKSNIAGYLSDFDNKYRTLAKDFLKNPGLYSTAALKAADQKAADQKAVIGNGVNPPKPTPSVGNSEMSDSKKQPRVLNAACNNADFELGNFTGWTGTYCPPTNVLYPDSYSCSSFVFGNPTFYEGPYEDYFWSNPTSPTNPFLDAGIVQGPVNNTQNNYANYFGLPATPVAALDGHQTFMNAASGNDAFMSDVWGINLPREWGNAPGGSGTTSVRLGNDSAHNSSESLSYSFVVTPANELYTYHYAVVLFDGGHPVAIEPYFKVKMIDLTTNTEIACASFSADASAADAASAGLTNQQYTYTNSMNQVLTYSFWYNQWKSISVPLTANMGDNVQVTFSTSDCGYDSSFATSVLLPPAELAAYGYTCPGMPGTVYVDGGHFAYAYIDAECASYKVTQTPQTCPNNNIVLNGPNGFINYAWTGPGIVGNPDQQSVNVNASGHYHLSMTIPGEVLCTATLDTVMTVTVLSPLTTTPASTPANCTANDGTASVSASSGGTPGYTYTWSNGGVGATISNLAAGTYTVTLTDNNGCTFTTSAIVAHNTIDPTVGLTGTNLTCNAVNTGSAVVNASGGTAPYTYSWSTGATALTINALSAATYSITVTDNTGCQTVKNVTLTQPTAVVAGTTSATPATCGANNGSVSVTTASGGTPNYTYLWSTGTSGLSVSNLGAATYTVTVEDANACSVTVMATVTNPGGGPTVSTSETNLKCHADNSGTATVTATGAGTITYTWSSGGATGPTETGLAAGTYTVTVDDNSGCAVTNLITLTQPAALVPGTATTTPAVCGNLNGSATVTAATGGTPNLAYNWSNGVSGLTNSNIGAGTYTVTVVDANSCTVSVTAVVGATGGGPTVSSTGSNLKCFNDNSGKITVTATGGGALSYTWSAGVAGTSSLAAGLAAGSYTVTVNDGSGCAVVNVISLVQPSALTLTGTGLPTQCFGACNGQAVVIPAGGTLAYSALWSSGGSTGLSISNLCAGNYSVTITDANNCQHDTVLNVAQPTLVTATTSSTPANCNQSNGSATVVPGGGTPGGTGYTYSWSNGFTGATTTNPGLPAGGYTVTVTDSKGCSGTSTATIQNLNGVNALMQSQTPPTCSGGCNGSAVALAKGGTGPYTYTWNNTVTGTTASNLCQGTYTVTITDKNLCTSTAVASLTSPTALVLPNLSPLTACIGASTTLTVNPSGGTPGYNVVWMPGAQTGSSITVSPAVSTTYTVTATDANGCASGQQTVTVNVNGPIVLAASNEGPVCPDSTVTLSSQAAGGNGSFSYTWLTNPVQSTQNIQVTSGNNTQTYTVIANDGCGTPADTVIVTLNVSPDPVVNFSADKAAGCPVLCVNFTDLSTVAGGAVTKWSWNFGNGSTSTSRQPQNCYTKSGNYSVYLTATSNNGCRSTDTIKNMITVFPTPVAAFTTNPSSTTIVNPTINYIDKSIGAANWLWSFGDTTETSVSTLENPTHTFANEGTYCAKLIVANLEGCLDSATSCVVIGPEFDFFVPNAFTPNGDGVNDTFNGKGIGINQYEMIVFDRWGNLIFTTYDLSVGWNGTANGGDQICQQDVYVYKIVLTDVFNVQHNYIGHITLVK